MSATAHQEVGYLLFGRYQDLSLARKVDLSKVIVSAGKRLSFDASGDTQEHHGWSTHMINLNQLAAQRIAMELRTLRSNS